MKRLRQTGEELVGDAAREDVCEGVGNSVDGSVDEGCVVVHGGDSVSAGGHPPGFSAVGAARMETRAAKIVMSPARMKSWP